MRQTNCSKNGRWAEEGSDEKKFPLWSSRPRQASRFERNQSGQETANFHSIHYQQLQNFVISCAWPPRTSLPEDVVINLERCLPCWTFQGAGAKVQRQQRMGWIPRCRTFSVKHWCTTWTGWSLRGSRLTPLQPVRCNPSNPSPTSASSIRQMEHLMFSLNHFFRPIKLLPLLQQRRVFRLQFVSFFQVWLLFCPRFRIHNKFGC